jgi:hypothetical protein
MRKNYTLFLVLLATVIMVGCKEINNMNWFSKAHKNDRLLAKAGNRSLYMSDLENLLTNNARKEDSSRLVNAYIDRWARESAMMLEAEKLVAKDANIDKMVNEYRSALLLSKYESNLVEMNTDTTISNADIAAYYQRNKSKFELDQTIVRCYYVKVKKDTPKMKDAEKWWNSKKDNDFLAFKKFATTYAEKVILNDTIWYSLDDLNSLLPKGSKIDSKKDVIIRGEKTDYNYFVRVLELVDKQTAPIDYVKDQIRKMIFHNRKSEKLDEQRRITYDKAVQQSNVKIYTQ